MNQLFSPDNKIFQFIHKLVFCAWLNILWFICSIPVITIGASTTALYDVCFKLVRDQEGNVTQQFFNSFKANFKKGTAIWGILLVLGVFLGSDGYVLYHIRFDNVFWVICTALLIGAVIIYLLIILNIFPLFAKFDNTIPMILKNAFLVGIRYLFCTIMMAIIYIGIYYIIINFFFPLIVIGQGLAAFLCCWLISPIIQKLEDAVTDSDNAKVQ